MFQEQPPKKKVTKTPKEDNMAPVDDSLEVKDSSKEQATMSLGNIIDLPSAGKNGYPSQITYREVMAADEEILKTATVKNYSRTVNNVLKSICNDVEWFDDMLIHDRDYVLSWIWANTYSSKKEFEITCSHCGTKAPKTINMFELPVINIHEKFKPKFEITIKKAEETINVRSITVRDECMAEKYLATFQDLKDGTPNPDKPSQEFTMLCLALEFKRPMDIASRIEWARANISSTEMANIKKYHQIFTFGIDTKLEHTCSECKGVTHTRVPFQAADILAPEVSTDIEELLLA